MAARAQARKPDWLQLSTPPYEIANSKRAHEGRPAQDTTARVLEFPATAQRRPTAASSRQLPPPPGSLLAAEPAYRSALSHLRIGGRPGTAPAAASTSLPPAAPPSSRLDALLVGRPGTAAAATTTTAARPASSRPDALLASKTTAHHPPLAAAPARSRLDELLATRPPPLATANAPLPSSRLDQLLASRPPLRPATAASAASGHSTSGAANGGHSRQPQPASLSLSGRRGPPAASAALSPFEEEPAAASQADRSVLVSAGRIAPATEKAAGAGARGGPPAGGMPDPALQERLRERIELAKAQIRQQLSPMFRLSEALLGAEQDPQGAAEALDAATGLSSNGFELLARRSYSRVGSAGAGTGSVGGAAARPQARQQRLLQQSGRTDRSGPRGSASLAGRRQHEKGGALLQPGVAAAAVHHASDASAILGSTDEVDSLVANARAAAARAQSALADLESPPRAQHQQQRQHAAPGKQQHTGKEAACVPAGEVTAAGPALRPAAALSHAQLAVSADGSGPAVVVHPERGLQAPQQPLLPVDGAEAHAWVDRLRQRSEDLIRTECERLVASMHLLFDDVWAGLKQELGQQREEAQQLRQQHPRQQEQLQQGPEPGAGAAASLEGSSTLAAGDDGYGESLQQALDAPASQQEDDARSGSLESSTSVHSEAGGAAWPAQEHEQHFEQLGDKQMQPSGKDDASGSENGNTAAFQFSLRGQHMQQQEGQQARQPACTGAGSLPAGQQLPQAVGAGFVGFGSPIRVLPSPAKPAAGARAPSRLQFAASEEGIRERAAEQADSWTADSSHGQEEEHSLHGEQQQLRLDEQHQPRLHTGSTAEQAVRAGSRGQAAADDAQATPALRTKAWPSGLRAPHTGLDPYHTARSITAPASEAGSAASDAFDSPRSPAAGSEGGGSSSGGRAGSSSGGLSGGPVPLGQGSARGASPTPQHVRPSEAATSPLLGAGRKDLDSIVGSIRRLAAEMRLKQGLVAMPSTGSMAQQGGSFAPQAHDTPSSASKLLFTPTAGSSSGSRATGALYTAGSVGPGGGGSLTALRKPLR